jgi:hypothetical protein
VRQSCLPEMRDLTTRSKEFLWVSPTFILSFQNCLLRDQHCTSVSSLLIFAQFWRFEVQDAPHVDRFDFSWDCSLLAFRWPLSHHALHHCSQSMCCLHTDLFFFKGFKSYCIMAQKYHLILPLLPL